MLTAFERRVKRLRAHVLSNNEEVIGIAHKSIVLDDGGEVVNLSGLKLTELKELAKQRGIKGYSKMKEDELIELLKEFKDAE